MLSASSQARPEDEPVSQNPPLTRPDVNDGSRNPVDYDNSGGCNMDADVETRRGIFAGHGFHRPAPRAERSGDGSSSVGNIPEPDRALVQNTSELLFQTDLDPPIGAVRIRASRAMLREQRVSGSPQRYAQQHSSAAR